MNQTMQKEDLFIRRVLLTFLAALIVIAFIADGPMTAIKSCWQLQLTPARLINDFIELGGTGGALLNAALVGLMGLIVIVINQVKLSGPTFAAVLTLVGFGLFGKTPLNILPIFMGVYLAARFTNKEYKQYILMALFGSALGPVVSFTAFEMNLTGATALITGALTGLVTGFLLPALAVAMLHLHQGYNLYNMGLTCGFFGLFASAIILSSGHKFDKAFHWFNETSPILMGLVPILALTFILTGFVYSGQKAWVEFKAIQKEPGRLPSDFMVLTGPGGALVNSGFIGLAGSLYIWLCGGDFNGPVIGGLLTIMGFAAFGTHLKNSWPVVAGVMLCALVFGHNLSAPGPILAAIFVTTLGPLAGAFGKTTGIIAGFIHLTLVLQTGSWHGGMNLYNNGFAGGLTAAFIVAVIQWYRSNKSKPTGKFGRL